MSGWFLTLCVETVIIYKQTSRRSRESDHENQSSYKSPAGLRMSNLETRLHGGVAGSVRSRESERLRSKSSYLKKQKTHERWKDKVVL